MEQNNSTVKQKKKTSYEKGRSLEVEFSEFMQSNLGWDSARVGVHLVGKLNRKGATVDVVGKRTTELGKKAMGTAKFFGVMAIAILAIGYHFENEFVVCMAIISGIIAVAYQHITLQKNQEHALVECKNLSGKAVSSHIDKTLRELDDYKSSGDKEFKFTKHYFVSANGYVETTLKYALEKGIICYVKNGDTFELEKYWK